MRTTIFGVACMVLGGVAFEAGQSGFHKADRLVSTGETIIAKRPPKDQERILPEGWKPGAI